MLVIVCCILVMFCVLMFMIFLYSLVVDMLFKFFTFAFDRMIRRAFAFNVEYVFLMILCFGRFLMIKFWIVEYVLLMLCMLMFLRVSKSWLNCFSSRIDVFMDSKGTMNFEGVLNVVLLWVMIVKWLYVDDFVLVFEIVVFVKGRYVIMFIIVYVVGDTVACDIVWSDFRESRVLLKLCNLVCNEDMFKMVFFFMCVFILDWVFLFSVLMRGVCFCFVWIVRCDKCVNSSRKMIFFILFFVDEIFLFLLILEINVMMFLFLCIWMFFGFKWFKSMSTFCAFSGTIGSNSFSLILCLIIFDIILIVLESWKVMFVWMIDLINVVLMWCFRLNVLVSCAGASSKLFMTVFVCDSMSRFVCCSVVFKWRVVFLFLIVGVFVV